MVSKNHALVLASVVFVVSAMCLGGTSVYLNAERRGETDTFDVSASFTALDENGNIMDGAAVRCSGTGGFSKSGTADSQGAWSFTETVALASGDCPKKTVEMSCYAEKGSVRTTTESGSVELWCQNSRGSDWTPVTSTSMPSQGDRADFDALSGIPATMCAGETRTVSLSVRNAGTTTWMPTSYRLASLTSQDWGVFAQSLSPAYTIGPGEKYTTSFQITAPSTTGTYGFQWEMKNDAGLLFGRPSGFTNIQVSACTPTTSTSTPSADYAWIGGIDGTTYTMCTKEIRTISVEMKNEGTTTWTPSYALVPATSYQWEVFHVPSGETTPPGSTKKFTFSIVAPSAPGKYPLQWQMRNAAGNLFPEKGPLSVDESSPWMITVATCTPTPAPAQGSSCSDSGVAYNLNIKGSCTPAAGKVCIGTGLLACSDLCNPENRKDWIRKYQCVTSGSDTGACGFSDYQCPAGCQDGACKPMYPA